MSGRHDDEFTEFVSARLGTLRRVAYLLCQDWQRSDDLVQAAVTRLYVHWERARGVEHIEAYAKTILVREFLGEQRSPWWCWAYSATCACCGPVRNWTTIPLH